VACGSGALAALAALAAALHTQAAPRASDAPLRLVPHPLLKAEASAPARSAKGNWSNEDDVFIVEDPCERRRKLTNLDDLKDLENMDRSEPWDPCKVSKEAAVKAEKMLKQAAHWEEHAKAKGGKGPSAASNKSKSSKVAAAPANSNATRSSGMEKKAEKVCSGSSEDCYKTKCCSEQGMQCYAKNKDWAECRASCNPGRDPSDVDSSPWSCEEVGERASGEPLQCAQNGDNCTESKCCNEPGSTCFSKNETYATCRQFCTPGPDYADEDSQPWRCWKMGPTKAGKADWVDEECSGDADDCSKTKCCKTSGNLCYEKGEGWAQCKAECSTEQPENEWEKPWTCNELGPRTPWPAPGWSPAPRGGRVAPWVKDTCSKSGVEDCSQTQCCLAVGDQCYMKAQGWAVCKQSCTPGPDPQDNNDTWSCDTLGGRSPGLAEKGWPSLFCFIVMRTEGYELPLVQAQWDARSGVFNCDGFVVFSDKVIDIGGTTSMQTPDIAVGVSKDNTAGNTELFMAIWDELFNDGRVWLYDWTIKADPDAVLLPDRLRNHLAPHTGWGEHDGKLYVVNCNAWPSSSSFPMLYGAVEVFSNKAMRAYAQNVYKCKQDLPWSDWGEDFFLTRCMDQIGVGRLLDFRLVGDDLCVGPGQGGAGDCDSPDRAAFHPFKKFDDWMNCFNKAIGRI